jgi:hypothetical protein
MGYLAGIECTYGMPEEDEREQNTSVGQATDNSFKFVKFGNSKRILTIPLHGFSTANKELLQTAFEASVTKMFKLIPDDHIDLGGGAGTGVYAQMLDDVIDFQKTNHEKWSGEFTFAFAERMPSDTMIGYSINHVKIEGTQSSPESFTTNTGKLQYRFGTTPFPAIILDDYTVTIVFGSYSDAKFNIIKDSLQQNGNNIDFQVAMNDGAIAESDGYVYADITILMDAKA